VSNDIEDFVPGQTRVRSAEDVDGVGTVTAVDEDAVLVTVKWDDYNYPPYEPDELDPDDLVIVEAE
jgi:hypothetical protein